MKPLSATAEDARYLRDTIGHHVNMSNARRSYGGTEAVKNMISKFNQALVGTKVSVRSNGKKGTIEVNIDLGPFALTNEHGEAVHHYVRDLLDSMGYEFTGIVRYAYTQSACAECFAVPHPAMPSWNHHYISCSLSERNTK